MSKDWNVRHPRLRIHFNKILKSWLNTIDIYSRENKDDALYVYNERATLSTLAGVIWRFKEYAMEEFISKKIKEKIESNGRVDLWFTFGNKTYLVEAKQVWPSMSIRAKNTVGILNDSLSLAVDNMKENIEQWEQDNCDLLGITFAVPYLPPSDQEPDKLPVRINSFIKNIQKVDCDFYGYVFPKNCVVIGEKNHVYPGLAILGRLI